MQYQQTEGAKLEKESFDKSTAINKKIEAFGKEFSEKTKMLKKIFMKRI